MRRVVVTIRHFRDGQIEQIRGHRIRKAAQLRHLRRHIKRVYDAEIISIDFE